MNLEQMSAPELVTTYNERAALLGEKPVIRFSDKAAAVRRTTKILKMPVPEAKKATKAKAKVKAEPKEKKARKKRGVYFKLPYHGDERFKTVRSETSLRGRCITLLKKGATFEQVQDMVRKFDSDTDNTTGNVERRSYEIVRIMHYYLGWGIDHDQATGIIQLHKRA